MSEVWNWNIENEVEDPADDEPFFENVGLKVHMNSNNPIDFLNLYITDKVLELMVIETNRNANQFIATRERDDNDNHNDSYVDTWVDVTIE